jgi:hypothetical protein
MVGADTGISIWLVLALAGSITGLWWRLEAKFSAIEKERLKLERDFADYKLAAERHFVSAVTLEKTENRLINAVDRLTARVEMLITRMEGVGAKVTELTKE